MNKTTLILFMYLTFKLFSRFSRRTIGRKRKSQEHKRRVGRDHERISGLLRRIGRQSVSFQLTINGILLIFSFKRINFTKKQQKKHLLF